MAAVPGVKELGGTTTGGALATDESSTTFPAEGFFAMEADGKGGGRTVGEPPPEGGNGGGVARSGAGTLSAILLPRVNAKNRNLKADRFAGSQNLSDSADSIHGLRHS